MIAAISPPWTQKPTDLLECISPGFTYDWESVAGRRRQITAFALATHFDSAGSYVGAMDVGTFATVVRFAKGIEVIRTLGLPDTAVRLLSKHTDCVRDQEYYQVLADYLACSPPREQMEALQNAHILSIGSFDVVSAVDPIALDTPVLTFIQDADSAMILNAHIDLLRSIGISEGSVKQHIHRLAKDYAQAIENVYQSDAVFFDAPLDIDLTSIGDVQLPAPPVSDSAKIVFLKTAEEMKNASRRFRNCLDDLVFQVANGERYFCLWRGRPEVVIELFNDAPAGFKIGSMRLAQNREVPEELRDEILGELEGIGIKNLPTWRLSLTHRMRSPHADDARIFWDSLRVGPSRSAVGLGALVNCD